MRYVLEGSVRKAGARVRITAQLIDATDDSPTSGPIATTARSDDIFSLQDQVTAEIVGALELQLGTSEPAPENRDAPSVEAYDHVLRARQYFFRFTREANAAGKAELEKALTIDPDYALAMAAMAECHLQVFHQAVERRFERGACKRPAEFARRAIALDENSSEGHSSLANVHSVATADMTRRWTKPTERSP